VVADLNARGELHAREVYGYDDLVQLPGANDLIGAFSASIWKSPESFEIDPLVLAYSRTRRFTYLADCAPQARVTIGDARLELARVPPASFDVLAIDAFTSDAIPLHLLTQEALGVYFRALAPHGVLLVHISNRHIDLAPVLGAEAARSGVLAVDRLDHPADRTLYSPSDWILLTRSRATLDKVRAFAPQAQWQPLEADAARPWTDDHASVLPHVRWSS